MIKTIGVTWFSHRRMVGLCAGLGVELYTLVSRRRSLGRYLVLGPRTIWLLLSRLPETLLIQNPSLALAVLATALRPLLGYRLVVDAHNEAVDPFIHRGRWSRRLATQLIRLADLTIVSNRWLADVVESAGGSAFVLPDAVPVLAVDRSPTTRSRAASLPRIAVIATYAPDEPIAAIFDAAEKLIGEVEFVFTGDSKKLPTSMRDRSPRNVSFSGFLDEDDYWALLARASAVMDLTLMDHCLVCGAYEALAVGRPVILSDNRASRDLFSGAAVFADNSAAGIVSATRELLRTIDTLEMGVAIAAGRLRSEWASRTTELRARVAGFHASN